MVYGLGINPEDRKQIAGRTPGCSTVTRVVLVKKKKRHGGPKKDGGRKSFHDANEGIFFLYHINPLSLSGDRRKQYDELLKCIIEKSLNFCLDDTIVQRSTMLFRSGGIGIYCTASYIIISVTSLSTAASRHWCLRHCLKSSESPQENVIRISSSKASTYDFNYTDNTPNPLLYVPIYITLNPSRRERPHSF